MTEAVQLRETDRVLEIGTGSGYQAAILGEIAKEVYTIELIQPLAKAAEERLKSLGYENVMVKQGDGYEGWTEHAPFDAIVVTASPPKIPEKLIAQLVEGGRMILPVGKHHQELILVKKSNGKTLTQRLFPVRFVPMVAG